MLDLFKVADEKVAIGSAYGARSGYVHAAQPYRDAALVGTSTRVSSDAFFDVMIGNETAPSILWFERLVSHSIANYVINGGRD